MNHSPMRILFMRRLVGYFMQYKIENFQCSLSWSLSTFNNLFCFLLYLSIVAVTQIRWPKILIHPFW